MRGLGEVGECMSVCCNIAEREKFYEKIILIYTSSSSWLRTTIQVDTSPRVYHYHYISNTGKTLITRDRGWEQLSPTRRIQHYSGALLTPM